MAFTVDCLCLSGRLAGTTEEPPQLWDGITRGFQAHIWDPPGVFVSHGLSEKLLLKCAHMVVSLMMQGTKAHLPWNLWEKDGTQKCPDTYFLSSGLVARNVHCLFSHYFATKQEEKSIRKHGASLLKATQNNRFLALVAKAFLFSKRDQTIFLVSAWVFFFLWVWYYNSEINIW